MIPGGRRFRSQRSTCHVPCACLLPSPACGARPVPAPGISRDHLTSWHLPLRKRFRQDNILQPRGYEVRSGPTLCLPTVPPRQIPPTGQQYCLDRPVRPLLPRCTPSAHAVQASPGRQRFRQPIPAHAVFSELHGSLPQSPTPDLQYSLPWAGLLTCPRVLRR